MASQIDLAPTILGLMNLDYTSKFLGYDIYKMPANRDRIFISTYQDMGYLKDGKLVILSPQQKAQMYRPDMATGINQKTPMEQNMLNEAISWYQGASFLFKSGRYKK